MAKQHFYSRVPARMAMFYKSNGFDTFAKSNGLEQSFIESNLQAVLEQKPTQEELSLIRKSELNPIYLHYLTKEGTFVESCVSFLATDYTKERSAYLVHSLIFNEKEEKEIHHHNHSNAINQNLFIHDLSSFNVTSPSSRPIKDYPELKCETTLLEDPINWLSKEYNPNTLKIFIFALFGIIFGKYKCVHVVLPNNNNYENSIKFFNSIIQIVPFHLRKHILFVSSCSDFNKYNGFNLKIIDESMGIAPISKGITINFKTQEIFGLKDKDLSLFGNAPDFFYRLISKKEERYELFRFFEYAIKKDKTKAELDIKTFNELIFLYICSSGFYEEKQVLQNDEDVLKLFLSYENNRNCLKDENRMTAIKCLNRYPENYQAIPKNIFSKVVKLYPDEINGTKIIIMSILLELIHTDLMRLQIFNFIKANYEDETSESKVSIINHLASVFNGEFLQEQILDFFSKIYDTTNRASRQVINDTLYLSIRTHSIQEQILDFFNKKYDKFNIKEKTRFYEVCAEHLPEGDALAEKLLSSCDSHIVKEKVQLKDSYSAALCNLLIVENRAKEKLLLPVICKSNGFTFDIVAQKVFTTWKSRKISTDFIKLCCEGNLTERVDKIIKVLNVAKSDMDLEQFFKFLKIILANFKTDNCTTSIQEILDCMNTLEKGLNKINKRMSVIFVRKMKQEVFDIMLANNFNTLFDGKTKNVVESLNDYAKDNYDLRKKLDLDIINNYLSLKQSIYDQDIASCLEKTLELYKSKELAIKIAFYIINDIYYNYVANNDENYVSKSASLVLLCSHYLKTGHLKINNVYDKMAERVTNNYLDEDYNQEIIQEDICKIFKNMIDVSSIVASNFSDNFSLQKDLESYESGIQVSAYDIANRYGKKQLSYFLDSMSSKNRKLIKFIEKETKSIKTNNTKVIKV